MIDLDEPVDYEGVNRRVMTALRVKGQSLDWLAHQIGYDTELLEESIREKLWGTKFLYLIGEALDTDWLWLATGHTGAELEAALDDDQSAVAPRLLSALEDQRRSLDWLAQQVGYRTAVLQRAIDTARWSATLIFLCADALGVDRLWLATGRTTEEALAWREQRRARVAGR